MLRHDDVAHHDEMIASAHALHYFKKQVASGGGLEQRGAAGNKLVVMNAGNLGRSSDEGSSSAGFITRWAAAL